MDLSPLFFFSIAAMQRNFTLVVQSKQSLLKLRFLQKLGCQKPCWDQNLSSLVNKQVAVQGAGCSVLPVKDEDFTVETG